MRFQCQPGCIKCCDQKGQVYLSEDDILRLAAYLGVEPQAFEARYVYRTRNLRRLRKPPKSKLQCPFLKEDGCSVHPAKPTQCSTFPFWPEMVQDKEEWRRTGRWCPGIGKGELIQISVARETAEKMRAAHPHIYGP